MSQGKAGSAKGTISSVHNQLNNAFLPAVKNVALSASELLKAHQGLQKASEAHAVALRGLADSAKSAQPGAQRHAKALHRLAEDYEQMMHLHKNTIKNLNFIAQKTVLYSNGEKDKLKEIKDNHHRKEKDILKAEKKGEKNEDDLLAFYEGEAKSFSTQQEMRYKFFVDKHAEWFESFHTMVKLSNERAEMNEHKKEEKKPEDNRGSVKEHKPNGDFHAPIEYAEIRHSPKEETRVFAESPVHEPPVVSQLEDEDNAPVEISKELVEPEGEMKAFGRADYIEQAQKRGVAVAVLPVGALPPAGALKKVEQREPAPPPVVVMAETATQAILPPVAEVSRPTQTPMHDPEPMPAPTVVHHHHVQPMLITSPTTAVAPKPLPKPASPVVIPSQFGASDYGKTLTVVQDYAASSGEQLTVATGDKVVLIKSGTRGWIFIRDCVSQRTGWIPSPFAYAY